MTKYFTKLAIVATVAIVLLASMTAVNSDASKNQSPFIDLYEGLESSESLPDGCSWDKDNCVLLIQKDISVTTITYMGFTSLTIVLKKTLTHDTSAGDSWTVKTAFAGVKITGGGKIVSDNFSVFVSSEFYNNDGANGLVLDNISIEGKSTSYSSLRNDFGTITIKDCPSIKIDSAVDEDLVHSYGDVIVKNSNLCFSRSAYKFDALICSENGAIFMPTPSEDNLMFFVGLEESMEFESGVTTAIHLKEGTTDPEMSIDSYIPPVNATLIIVILIVILAVMAVGVYEYRKR